MNDRPDIDRFTLTDEEMRFQDKLKKAGVKIRENSYIQGNRKIFSISFPDNTKLETMESIASAATDAIRHWFDPIGLEDKIVEASPTTKGYYEVDLPDRRLFDYFSERFAKIIGQHEPSCRKYPDPDREYLNEVLRRDWQKKGSGDYHITFSNANEANRTHNLLTDAGIRNRISSHNDKPSIIVPEGDIRFNASVFEHTRDRAREAEKQLAQDVESPDNNLTTQSISGPRGRERF